MARGAQSQASQAAQTAGSVASGAQGTAGTLFKQLFPFYSGEITNPTGYGASDLAAMNTASGESTGGSVAGAVGQGNLQAARTRNAGAFQAAADESARAGMRQNSTNALKTQEANANLKQKQQQAGAEGIGNLYGQNVNEMLAAMGLQNQDINTEIKAGQSGWFQNMLGFLNAIKPGGNFGSGGNSFSFGG